LNIYLESWFLNVKETLMNKVIQVKLKIDGMSCQHCVMRIQKALQKVPGVSSVKVDLAKEEAEVTTDRAVQVQDLISAVVDAGYEARVI